MSDFSSKRTERHTDPLPPRKLPADYRPPCCLFTVRSDRHTAGNTYSSAMFAELTLDSLTASQIHYCLFQLYSWSADGLPSVNSVCCVHIPLHTEANANVNVTSVHYSPGVVPSRRKHDHPEASFHWSLRDWHPYVPRGWSNWNCFLAYWSFECVDSRSRMSP